MNKSLVSLLAQDCRGALVNIYMSGTRQMIQIDGASLHEVGMDADGNRHVILSSNKYKYITGMETEFQYNEARDRITYIEYKNGTGPIQDYKGVDVTGVSIQRMSSKPPAE